MSIKHYNGRKELDGCACVRAPIPKPSTMAEREIHWRGRIEYARTHTHTRRTHTHIEKFARFDYSGSCRSVACVSEQFMQFHILSI